MPGDRRAETLRQLQPYVERARRFSGWLFDDVRVRPLTPDPPWDYSALARAATSRAEAVIDLGTGGGERFAEIIAGLPARAVATEEWGVNAPVARDRLRALDVPVVRCATSHLPFAGATFDLILGRHEALEPPEALRVLRPGGTILTQQVGPDNWPELRRFFPRKTRFPNHYEQYAQAFADAGLRVERQWHEQRVAYATLGDVVYMQLIAPWDIPDFDPVKDLDALLALEDACRTPDGIVLTEHRYLIVAGGKPAQA